MNSFEPFTALWAAYEEGQRQRAAGLLMSADAFTYDDYPDLRPAYEAGYQDDQAERDRARQMLSDHIADLAG